MRELPIKGLILSATIPPSFIFPNVEFASDDGLLCIGGELSPDVVIDALVHGIFPWSVYLGEEVAGLGGKTKSENKSDGNKFGAVQWNGYAPDDLESLEDVGETLGWWSPNPRAIFELNDVHIPRRLARTMRSGKFDVTFDQAFPEVMLACAKAGNRIEEGTWITREFFDAYCALFERGFAHSVETWSRDTTSGKRRLVGGVYGVAINAFFDGESMFSVETDASKVALFTLLTRLKERNFQLFDLQILNPHTESLGGVEIPRQEYLLRLEKAASTPIRF